MGMQASSTSGPGAHVLADIDTGLAIIVSTQEYSNSSRQPITEGR